MSNLEKIRNFCIIAHIDHGKSTLADRFLEMTGTIEKRQMKEQYLDQLELERERGITIKMAPVRMLWHPENPKLKTLNPKQQNGLEFRVSDLEFTNSKQEFVLNLIDTPGHNDFKYEVSRALAAVEGAILLVDASQGIQAQTLANFENAKRAGLKIIGAINKVDLNPHQIEEVVDDLANLLEVDRQEISRVSGKTGFGVTELLEKVIEKVPHPDGRQSGGRALIFDSLYDDHKGVIAFVRMFGGELKRDDQIKFIATKTSAKIKEVGYFYPGLKADAQLSNGEIGYVATGLKDPGLLKIGDTIVSILGSRTSAGSSTSLSDIQKLILPGYQEPPPVVFVSFYPEDPNEYEDLKKALAKLRLTDASLNFEPDASEVLGRGFKGGFLGRLHFEITAERLEKEYKIRTVHSFPSVAYRIKTGEEGWATIKNPKDFPNDYLEVQEPMTLVEILTPSKYLGGILSLKEIFRFGQFETKNLGAKILLTANLPLADLISDLDDKLKSLSEGYASLSYEITGYERGDLEKLEILIAGHLVPGLTRILPKEKVEREARLTVERLRELLPRQQFSQAIQATARGRIIARETIPALRKDVTGYLYGGDRTRKMKLWKKQQRGKTKLKAMAEKSDIKIPASVFKELLKK